MRPHALWREYPTTFSKKIRIEADLNLQRRNSLLTLLQWNTSSENIICFSALEPETGEYSRISKPGEKKGLHESSQIRRMLREDSFALAHLRKQLYAPIQEPFIATTSPASGLLPRSSRRWRHPQPVPRTHLAVEFHGILGVQCPEVRVRDLFPAADYLKHSLRHPGRQRIDRISVAEAVGMPFGDPGTIPQTLQYRENPAGQYRLPLF